MCYVFKILIMWSLYSTLKPVHARCIDFKVLIEAYAFCFPISVEKINVLSLKVELLKHFSE